MKVTSPNGTLPDIAAFYPGDEYVDWTCLDGYNSGPAAEPRHSWRSFAHLFGPSYRQITERIAPDKPMIIGETASAEKGGSKADWISRTFASLPAEFPRVRGLIWFDKEEPQEELPWPLESSEASRRAFGAGISAPRYLGDEFGDLDASPIPPPG